MKFYKIENNCSLKKYISEDYVNLCEFIDNNVFTIKNVLTAFRVVWVSGGSSQKPQNGQFKAF